MRTQINAQQAKAARAYQGGEFAYIIERPNWHGELAAIGDSLFTFLMMELSSDEDCTGDADALRRIKAAMQDLASVHDAFEHVAE